MNFLSMLCPPTIHCYLLQCDVLEHRLGCGQYPCVVVAFVALGMHNIKSSNNVCPFHTSRVSFSKVAEYWVDGGVCADSVSRPTISSDTPKIAILGFICTSLYTCTFCFPMYICCVHKHVHILRLTSLCAKRGSGLMNIYHCAPIWLLCVSIAYSTQVSFVFLCCRSPDGAAEANGQSSMATEFIQHKTRQMNILVYIITRHVLGLMSNSMWSDKGCFFVRG